MNVHELFFHLLFSSDLVFSLHCGVLRSRKCRLSGTEAGMREVALSLRIPSHVLVVMKYSRFAKSVHEVGYFRNYFVFKVSTIVYVACAHFHSHSLILLS